MVMLVQSGMDAPTRFSNIFFKKGVDKQAFIVYDNKAVC